VLRDDLLANEPEALPARRAVWFAGISRLACSPGIDWPKVPFAVRLKVRLMTTASARSDTIATAPTASSTANTVARRFS
jgi:hypothetical protein